MHEINEGGKFSEIPRGFSNFNEKLLHPVSGEYVNSNISVPLTQTLPSQILIYFVPR